MTETIQESHKPSRKEQFARAALGALGIGMIATIPVVLFRGGNIPPEMAAATTGGGIYLFGSVLSQSAKTLKECFTQANAVVPAIMLGAVMAGVMGYGVHVMEKGEAQFAADRLTSPRIAPDEVISETAQQKFCHKSSKPYDMIVTINNQKRLLTCP